MLASTSTDLHTSISWEIPQATLTLSRMFELSRMFLTIESAKKRVWEQILNGFVAQHTRDVALTAADAGVPDHASLDTKSTKRLMPRFTLSHGVASSAWAIQQFAPLCRAFFASPEDAGRRSSAMTFPFTVPSARSSPLGISTFCAGSGLAVTNLPHAAMSGSNALTGIESRTVANPGNVDLARPRGEQQRDTV
ncbi:Aste57867_8998 [Aphanomyces stellatus]|uniref:Aste57867_8998 protein n=1 Tax=Aphanomyces stellatus TaxID=120398 RepID=A0A485KLP9_9STRA|nr:hypothetical protein As57867_008963 [Aphanomyces stellatus]VFT85882.1 Aste57867_8998 [Aphanomyces stellatus]